MIESVGQRRLLKKVGLSLFGVGIILILLFPVYWMFQTSVMPTERILSKAPALVPELNEMGLESYVTVFGRRPLLRWLSNSILVSVGTTLLSMLISVPAGYSLSRYRIHGQEFMGFFLLLSRMLPGTLLVIPLYIILNRVGLLNTRLALIMADSTIIVPFSTWMMKGFFDSIPYQLEESAMLDGASPVTALVRIVLPLSTPGLAAVTIYAVILSWNEFLFARTLITQPELWPFTVGIVSFIGEHMVSWDSLMAAGLVFVLPLFAVFFILEPFLVSGLTSGSVKY